MSNQDQCRSVSYHLIQDQTVGDEYSSNRVLRYGAFYQEVDDGRTSTTEQRSLTIAQWIEYMTSEEEYRDAVLKLSNLIKDSPFRGVRFETKGVNAETAETESFEFVLVQDDRLADFAEYSDPYTFAEQLAPVSSPSHSQKNDAPSPGAAFLNLGGDAMLVSPVNDENGDKNRYGHIAKFIREAPTSQVLELWRLVAETYRKELIARSPKPVWFSTAGGGVRWLHFRFDKRPKYYRYAEFKREMV